MNWHILGAGSQGLLWASKQSAAGSACSLLVRAGQRAPDAIIYEQNGQQIETHVANTPARMPEYLLVTVKVPDLAAALQGLGLAAANLKLVVLLQNGIGAESVARDRVGSNTVIWLGSSTHGSFRKARNHVVHAGVGGIWLGPGRGTLPADQHAAALTSLQASGLQVQWDAKIQTRLWHKLAVNSCINPLTALLNCRNGELLQLPLAQQWLPHLAEEAAAVVSGEGHPISTEQLLKTVEELATATAGNYNSMQQDYHQGRETEIAFITGTLLSAAQRQGRSLPHHAELLTRVQQRQPFVP
jgi:2-dehydropantoate 2-reductase